MLTKWYSQINRSRKKKKNRSPILTKPSPDSFLFIFIFSNKHYNFYNKYMWKMFIQYKVLGFKPTTFRIWFSSHKHLTRSQKYLWVKCQCGVAAIAPWFCLRLPSCGPGSNPMHTIYAFFNLYWNCNEKRTKINKKRPGLARFFKMPMCGQGLNGNVKRILRRFKKFFR